MKIIPLFSLLDLKYIVYVEASWKVLISSPIPHFYSSPFGTLEWVSYIAKIDVEQ